MLFQGKRSGVWKTYANNKIQTTQAYVNGQKNGLYTEYDHLRYLINKAHYLHDQLHGLKARYKRGRPMEEANYSYGKLHGEVRKYFQTGAEQGKIQQSMYYQNGVLHGPMHYFNPEGSVTLSYEYVNGKKKEYVPQK